MDQIIALTADPAAWAALATLVVMEVVLGIDNLIFISILTNKLPAHQQAKARRVGIGLALVPRLGSWERLQSLSNSRTRSLRPSGSVSRGGTSS
jgi:predicted tellurium resistance membrane protein TerC